jgi:NUMOD4 motif
VCVPESLLKTFLTGFLTKGLEVKVMEEWKSIKNFENYSVSTYGRVRNDNTDRIMALTVNQYGVVCIGMMLDGKQCHRSVPLLVAKAFITQPFEAFDTPINLDGDRHNNHIDNLVWRPRWFAIRYNRQFHEPYRFHIPNRIENISTGEISENSLACAKRYGLLEEDLVLSIFNRTYVWPTYEEFRAIAE